MTHAKLSASGSYRWMNCAASVRMEEGIEDTSSDFANQGTVAHEVAEDCLRFKTEPEAWLGKTHVLIGEDGEPYYEYEVDQEMVDAVQLYIDFVNGVKGQLLIEQRVDYSPWVPDGFGTSDAVVIEGSTVNIIDLKYGKGVKVDADNNSQAMLYALGAMNEYEFIFDDIDTFNLVIVQPRLDHISEWTVTREQLLAFGEEAKAKAELTQQQDAPFTPGEKQCKFCKASATCRALAAKNLEIAAEEFQDVVVPITVKSPDKLTNDEIAVLLPQLAGLTNWVKSLEAHALALLEVGQDIPGYKLVAGRSIRKWSSDESAEAALRSCSKLKVADIFTKKLVSPTQAEKLLGKGHPILKEHCIKPDGKPAIAPESDKRPAIVVELGADFKEVA